MAAVTDYFRKKLGWCPNAELFRAPPRTGKDMDCETAWKGQAPGNDPPPDPGVSGDESLPGYRENMLLIIIAAVWFFPAAYGHEFLPVLLVLSAVAMYCDAQNIHAGEKHEKETLLGNIVTWRPLTWGAATFVAGIVIMAIYLFHRKEIYRSSH